MARSRTKQPNTGCAKTSDKWWKRKVHRKLRKAVKKALRREDDAMPIVRELSDVWDSSRDFKGYWQKPHESDAYQRAFIWEQYFPGSSRYRMYSYYSSVEYWERQAFRK